MVDPGSADMIVEATLAVKFDRTYINIIDTVHPILTINEVYKQVCQPFRRDLSKMNYFL